ncbi:triose-phosphate transporter family-domain-containing protein [Blastocladiella britannica]|nr:triose-phosphate transporter family-domain-containing protein [Blastocladiella britannica]
MTRGAFDRTTVVNVACIAGWYASSTVLSIYNKKLFGQKYFDYRSPAAASALQSAIVFALCALVVHVLLRARFAPLRASFRFLDWRSGYLVYAVPASIFAALDIFLSNTALRSVTIPAYIMVKNSAPVFVLVSAWAFGLDRITPRLVMILSTILMGVGLAVEGDVKYTPLGLACVLGAAACSGVRWALTQLLMRWHETQAAGAATHAVDAATTHLHPSPSPLPPRKASGGAIATLYTLSPFMTVFLGIVSLVGQEPADPRVGAGGDAWLNMFLVLGGVLAFAMVACEFLLIQGTSVLALSVAGLAKEIVLISASMLVFGDSLSLQNVAGLLLSMVGIAWYNHHRTRQASGSRPVSPASPRAVARGRGEYIMLDRRKQNDEEEG